jgi:hypothetical protein
MAFVSSGYNPDKPMEDRISDIGPKKYDEFYPPVIAKNKGKWLYHDVLKPGVLVHVAESGDKVAPPTSGKSATSRKSTAAATYGLPLATTSNLWSMTRRKSIR